MDPLVRWRCVAKGRVQGVYYRARVAEAARRQGLAGTVRNASDGTVVIEVQGAPGAIDAFLRDITGPSGLSDATSVERVAELPPAAGAEGFEIVR